MAKWLQKKYWAFYGLGLAVAIQFIPVNRTNPPERDEPQWDSPRTAELARRACYDCHSHETEWPWYSQVAPLSWWIAHHVNHGREYVNYSVAPFGKEADESAHMVETGEMPLWPYDWIYQDARKLTPEEKADLIAGLKATFGDDHHTDGHSHTDEVAHEAHDD